MEFKDVVLTWLSKYSKRYKRILLKKQTKDLNNVKLSFTKASVRYGDSLDELVRVTRNINYLLEEDLRLFNEFDISTFTTSSSKALEVVDYYLGDGYNNKPTNYFRASYDLKKVNYLDWYSNSDIVSDLVVGMRELLLAYLAMNDINWEGNIPKHLENFLNDKEFKLLVLDYISLLTLMLEVDLSNLN